MRLLARIVVIPFIYIILSMVIIIFFDGSGHGPGLQILQAVGMPCSLLLYWVSKTYGIVELVLIGLFQYSLLSVAIVWIWEKLRRTEDMRLCGECHYDLRGCSSATKRCPECGARIPIHGKS
jgi:hypothetical protein